MPLSAQRVDVGVGQVGAAVDRGQPELGGKRDARAGIELVGVQPAAQSDCGAGGEDRPRLVLVERTGLRKRRSTVRGALRRRASGR